MVGSALMAEEELLNNCLRGPCWPSDGPDLLFGGRDVNESPAQLSLVDLAVNLCLSGPEDCASGDIIRLGRAFCRREGTVSR